MVYEVEIFVPHENVEAEKDFCYMIRKYDGNVLKECESEHEKVSGILYLLETPFKESLTTESLSEEFPHIGVFAVESLRATKRKGELEKIRSSDFGKLFSLAAA